MPKGSWCDLEFHFHFRLKHFVRRPCGKFEHEAFLSYGFALRSCCDSEVWMLCQILLCQCLLSLRLFGRVPTVPAWKVQSFENHTSWFSVSETFLCKSKLIEVASKSIMFLVYSSCMILNTELSSFYKNGPFFKTNVNFLCLFLKMMRTH